MESILNINEIKQNNQINQFNQNNQHNLINLMDLNDNQNNSDDDASRYDASRYDESSKLFLNSHTELNTNTDLEEDIDLTDIYPTEIETVIEAVVEPLPTTEPIPFESELEEKFRAYNDKYNKSNPNTLFAIKKIGSSELRTEIITKYIRPQLISNINDAFIWRNRWGSISQMFYGTSEIFTFAQTIISFIIAADDQSTLALIAGIIGIISLSFNRFGSYATASSTARTVQINDIIHLIGIKDKLPDLITHKED